MTSHRQSPPLHIRPGFSRWLAGFVILSHTLAFAAVLMLPDPWRLLLFLVGASFAYQMYVHVLGRAPWSIRALHWHADGQWTIELINGREIQARLSPSTFVTLPLVALNLDRGRLGRWSLPLFSDAMDQEQLRTLRQRLRIEGVGAQPNSASV